MVLLDFSRAYDKVRRNNLLNVLLIRGVPFRFQSGIRDFCSIDKQVCSSAVSRGGAGILRGGLPQGSVLSPLLILFFIDNLRTRIPEGVSVSIYADDVALKASSDNK